MDVLTSGISTAGSVMNEFWALSLTNPIILIPLVLGVVGMCLSLFFFLKSRLTGKRKKSSRKR